MANGNGAKADVLKRSVTRADHPDSPRGGVYRFQFPAMLEFETTLPRYGTIYRDRYLRYSTLRESQWASAVHIAQTKVASLDAEITGETDGTRLKHWQELWVQVDRNQSPSAYLQKGVRDFLTTNNGQFIEVVRATQGQGSRIIGLVHLDSLRCRRTGAEDVPVIYTDLMGVEHELRDYQVIMLSDDPDPGDQFFGMGHCAAERAYHTIMRLSGIEVYVTEKVTGQRPLAIYIVNGNVDEQMLVDGLATAKDMRQAQGYTQYMGAVIIPIVDPTATPNVATIPLAELPDGFDPDAERKRADLVYANALGIDPQEVNPDLLASRAMGTGAQSRVIEEKEAGKGLVTWRKTFPHLMNQYVYPERVTFAFSERDLRDEQAKAQLALTRAQARGQMITNQEINGLEARNLAVDADDLPREYLREDVTPQETVTDTDKLPTGETPTPQAQSAPAPTPPIVPPQAQATKADESGGHWITMPNGGRVFIEDGGGGGGSSDSGTGLRIAQQKVKDIGFYSQKVEQAVCYDADGNETYSNQGHETGVAVDLDKIHGGHFVHNHPSGEGYEENPLLNNTWTFSRADIEIAAQADLASITATGEHATYVMIRPAGGWGDHAANMEKARGLLRDTPEYMNDYLAYRNGRFGDSPEQLNRQAIKFWRAYAKAIGADFKITKRK